MSENDRYLLNWLSTRVTRDAKIAPGHEDERDAILSRIVMASRRGLSIRPGAYTPRPHHLRWEPSDRTYIPVDKETTGEEIAEKSKALP